MSALDTIPILGIVFEPSLVVGLLVAGVWINRNKKSLEQEETCAKTTKTDDLPQSTAQFKHNRASRFLAKYPFIFEVFYWACTYWLYQISRAITTLTFRDETPQEAQAHAIEIVNAEKTLGIHVEVPIQQWFLAHPFLMALLNNVYSFVHIPATIAFLIALYYFESTKNFSAVRRTMAMCNAIAFVVFTAWPVMPPRLLPASFGFIDTVHATKTASVWTANRFCNVYAAMPSLHFGFALIIGCSLVAYGPFFKKRLNFLGALYPITILAAIVATANHYILDAVGGLLVVALGFGANRAVLYLLPVESWMLRKLHLHKPLSKDELRDSEKAVELESLLQPV